MNGERVMILGLDGLSWSLARKLRPLMPCLNELMDGAAAGPMRSTRPEISPTAWTTFFTASPPAEHGVYGFTDFAPNAYDVRLNASGDVKSPFLWDWVGLSGRRSVVLNVPMTYPAMPVNGMMVSGFVALSYERAAHPAWLAQRLKESGYRLEADFEKVHQDREVFLQDLSAALEGRMRLLSALGDTPWDLFVLVITDTDRFFHFFLKEYLEGGPVTEYGDRFFRRVDDAVGQVLELARAKAADGPLTLVMLSDHGFAPTEREFHLNRWLAAHGFQPGPGRDALALALDPTRIYINRAPRFPGGRVAAAEADRLMAAIQAALASEPAVAGVLDGRGLYDGPQAHLAPDLVVAPEAGWEFKAKFTPGPIVTDSVLMGAHTYENAFYLFKGLGGAEPAGRIDEILDLGRLVAGRLGVDRG